MMTPEPTAIVHFELHGYAKRLSVGMGDERIGVFSVGDIEVRIRHEWDAEGDPFTDDEDSSDSVIVACASRAVPESVLNALVERERDLADAETPGPMTTAQLGWLVNPPKDVVSHLMVIQAELREAASRLARILRWMFNRVETPQPFYEKELWWSLNGETWYSAPRHHHDQSSFTASDGVVGITTEFMPVIQTLLDDEEFEEPLARQLLLEGGALAYSNPRAAWVLAIAAAEVGIKRFAASNGSQSEAWLITEIQSPPLFRLISHYLPLQVETEKWSDESAPIPKAMRKSLQDGAETRNLIIHQGTTTPAYDDVVELLQTVNDFLYLLDWFSGHEWVWAHIRHETRQAWSTRE